VATFTERVQVIIDFVERRQGGDSPFAKLKADVAGAEGAMGKLKAASAGVGGVLSSVGPQVWAAAGAAAVGFLVKSTQAFEALALSSSKFAAATGLAVDEASRWAEVGGDVGVGVDTLTVAFNKLATTAEKSPDSLAKYGAEVVRAKDGTVDMNATILNVIEALNKLDPAKRAAAMKEIFGKGAVGGAQLFSLSVDEIRQRLADVSDSKVIDEEEQAKAERLRDAVDSLKDAWDNVVLTVGEVGAGLAPALELIGQIVGGVTDLDAKLQEVTGGFSLFTGGLGFLGQAWDAITGKSKDSGDAQKQALTDVGDEADDASIKVRAIGDAWDAVMGKIKGEQSDLRVADQFDQARDAATKAWDAASKGADDAKGKTRDARQAIVDTKLAVADYAREVLGLPPEQVTDILAKIDQGSLDSAESQLDALAKTRRAEILVKTVLQNTLSFLPGGKPVVTGTAASAAPSTMVAAQAGMPIALAAPMVATVPVQVQVNLPVGADESRTVAALHRWSRRNGSLLNAGVWTG